MATLEAMNDTIRVGSVIDEKGGRFAQEYEIEPMEGEFTRTITVIEEQTISRLVNGQERFSIIRKMKKEQQPFTKGFMIYYPQAHSIFVAADDTEQLTALGIPLDADGEVILDTPRQLQGLALSAKEAVQKSEGRRRRSTVGGIEEAMKG